MWIEAGETATAPSPQAPEHPGSVIENGHVRVELDASTGAIRSLRHKASGREFVQQDAGCLLNQAIYEQVESPDDRNAIASWRGPRREVKRDVPFKRTVLTATRVEAGAPRPFARSLLTAAMGPNDVCLSTEIILYDHTDRIDVVNTLDKLPTSRAEALYHAFPLATRHGQICLDVPGGAMRPGLDQVPGTATDWHSIQDWFAVAEEDYAVVVASPDVPLVQCTGINTGKWHHVMPASNGVVMSWVLNNYWFTNFPVRQGGRVVYSYSIGLQDGPFDPARAARFGTQMRRRAWGRAVRLVPNIRERLRRDAS